MKKQPIYLLLTSSLFINGYALAAEGGGIETPTKKIGALKKRLQNSQKLQTSKIKRK